MSNKTEIITPTLNSISKKVSIPLNSESVSIPFTDHYMTEIICGAEGTIQFDPGLKCPKCGEYFLLNCDGNYLCGTCLPWVRPFYTLANGQRTLHEMIFKHGDGEALDNYMKITQQYFEQVTTKQDAKIDGLIGIIKTQQATIQNLIRDIAKLKKGT